MKKGNGSPGLWDANSFRAWIDAAYGNETLYVLANRQPSQCAILEEADSAPIPASGGLVTALEPLIENCDVVWVARGAEAPQLRIRKAYDAPNAPPANPRLRVRCVSLTSEQDHGYYHGFCNEGLWPLCHRARVQPSFRSDDFRMYSRANAEFVEALYEEVTTDSPLVLVQDYHLALAPGIIRERLPLSTIVTFWHVPFPTPGVLSACPWERELLEGLLASSLVGFQTVEDCRNFLDATVCVLGAYVDRDENVVTHAGRRTMVRPYPVSVEWPSRSLRQLPPVSMCRSSVLARFGVSPQTQLIVGIDRLDYTKGLHHKLLALERLLLMRPEFHGKVVLLQLAEPSRSSLKAYQDCRTQLLQTADRINTRFGGGTYRPVILVERHIERREVFEWLRAAAVCYVGSLHDGMNLVAKEFISARDDRAGVLILSEYAGAARQLQAALCVNPYSIDDCARTLADALSMPVDEQSSRMRSLRDLVRHHNGYKWAVDLLRDAATVREWSSDKFALQSATVV